MRYEEFLNGKRITHESAGFADARKIRLNSQLFDWQRDLVHWALRVGRADHWCDCGLGKTFMQLEWARAVYERINKSGLILTPLVEVDSTSGEIIGRRGGAVVLRVKEKRVTSGAMRKFQAAYERARNARLIKGAA